MSAADTVRRVVLQTCPDGRDTDGQRALGEGVCSMGCCLVGRWATITAG